MTIIAKLNWYHTFTYPMYHEWHFILSSQYIPMKHLSLKFSKLEVNAFLIHADIIL